MEVKISKEEVTELLNGFYRKKRIFFIISMVLFGLSFVASDVFSLLYFFANEDMAYYMLLGLYLSLIVGMAGAIVLFMSRRYYNIRIGMTKAMLAPMASPGVQNEPGVVDVKVVEEDTKEAIDPRKQELINQYEELLKQGLITQEDFDKRKAEILK